MKKQLLAIAAVVMIGAAACGGDDKGDEGMSGHDMGGSPSATASSGVAAGSHNDQDVNFAQMMIPHHRQAVEMAKVVTAGSGNAEVKALAGQIEKAQAPEIETMTGWLKQWGATVPAEGGSMPGMDHGSMPGMGSGGDMPGMMSEREMTAFGRLKGAALDKRFLTMMIKHHEGAVTMAKDEQAKGSYGPAKTLAGSIVQTQQAEITKMKAMLK